MAFIGGLIEMAKGNDHFSQSTQRTQRIFFIFSVENGQKRYPLTLSEKLHIIITRGIS